MLKIYHVLLQWLIMCVVTDTIEPTDVNNFDIREESLKHKEKDNSGAAQSDGRRFVDTIPGDPATDYPTYTTIPRTEFSCKGRTNWGYYADIQTQCQVFHICQSQYQKISFLCPTGSIFNQKYLVCDWWYNSICVDVLYADGNDFHEPEFASVVLLDKNEFDLNLASSGGNSEHDDNNKITENNSSKMELDKKMRKEIRNKAKKENVR